MWANFKIGQEWRNITVHVREIWDIQWNGYMIWYIHKHKEHITVYISCRTGYWKWNCMQCMFIRLSVRQLCDMWVFLWLSVYTQLKSLGEQQLQTLRWFPRRGAVFMSRGCLLELAAALCDPQLRAAEQRLGASAVTASVTWVAICGMEKTAKDDKIMQDLHVVASISTEDYLEHPSTIYFQIACMHVNQVHSFGQAVTIWSDHIRNHSWYEATSNNQLFRLVNYWSFTISFPKLNPGIPRLKVHFTLSLSRPESVTTRILLHSQHLDMFGHVEVKELLSLGEVGTGFC